METTETGTTVKLVLALSEIKVSVVSLLYRNREFRCFDLTETNRRPAENFGFSSLFKTESFDVSIDPKQTEDQPKQFEREHIWVFF